MVRTRSWVQFPSAAKCRQVRPVLGYPAIEADGCKAGGELIISVFRKVITKTEKPEGKSPKYGTMEV